MSVEITERVQNQVRTVETVTLEIRTLHRQAQQIILGYAIEIGRRLIEVKALLPHGEWGDYLKREVEYSRSTANNFMKIFEEYGADQQSLFGGVAKSQAIGNLTYTKALKLLALPADEREPFAEEHDVEKMSTRELEKAIQERKEALEAKEAAEAAREKMAQEASLAKSRIDTLTEEAGRHLDTMEALRRELEELKARPIDITATNVPDASALEEARRAGAEEAAKTARQAAEAKLKEKLDKAAKAKAEAEAALKAASAERDALQDRATALEKQVKAASGKDLATASVCFEAAQENVNKVLGVVQKLALSGNAEEHNKLVDALHALFSALEARVPEKLEVSVS